MQVGLPEPVADHRKYPNLVKLVRQRRSRDNQLKQLQERLAKTEAQLALNRPRPSPSVHPQSRSEALEPVMSSTWTATPDFLTSTTSSRRSSQYQLQTTANPHSQATSALENSVTNTPMDMDRMSGMSAALGSPTNRSSLLDTDLFTSFAEGVESNMTFAWTNQPLMALEQLDNVLLNQPASAVPQSSSEEDLSPTDLSLLHNNYFESVYHSFPFVDRDRFAALIFIGRFEAMNRKLERHWLTLGRAAMLCDLLRLHRMDEAGSREGMQSGETQGGALLGLPHTDDPVLLEERRRTFWGLYILQSYVRTRTELSDQPTITGAVEVRYRTAQDAIPAQVKKTDDLFIILKRHLNATSIREDPVAFSLYLNLRATEIFSHDSAIRKSEEQGLPPMMIAESQRRAITAAFQICSAVGMNLPSPWKADSDIIMLQAIFIAWPLTMALRALHRELVHGGVRDAVNGVMASARLLFAALDHIEESDGYWHQCVADVRAKLQEWDEKNGFDSLAL
ncbi:hypothetical protein SNOG_06678 [Parastagonospora nodorum SN15]|uniref:Transcription factor domain-containing protein n=2 Tax=Phaeosphaeria nodorum (strain SN15 / ATCC MYA-4574 / FGSC 10173) TaxID=321614 RepID=Q0UNI6_PHANO|nr:hypothetical protein SNOG_06678 [Parastagonospora nodorum SN15]EAT86509.1 hypothetical protein SNOG_06678 [Parastagonospora nodorum SN15]QRC99349.1 hypothetical protein JI435_066780 [Parastagonospora nodorum SN15]